MRALIAFLVVWFVLPGRLVGQTHWLEKHGDAVQSEMVQHLESQGATADDAHDAAQQVITKWLEREPTTSAFLDFKKSVVGSIEGQLGPEGNWQAYARTAAMNHYRNMLEARARSMEHERKAQERREALSRAERSTVETVIERETQSRTKAAIDRVSPEQKVLLIRRANGESLKDIFGDYLRGKRENDRMRRELSGDLMFRQLYAEHIGGSLELGPDTIGKLGIGTPDSRVQKLAERRGTRMAGKLDGRHVYRLPESYGNMRYVVDGLRYKLNGPGDLCSLPY